MVVCKYVGPKTTSGAAVRALRASTSPRSPTSARESMEDLFVTFTDAHRKVLNLMVRNNPSLMSGSFSLLVHNPRVLDFDNKRNYFNQQLHRRPHNREHHGTLQLNVRRQRVFEDSFQYLQRKTGDQIKYGKLSVRFYDEEGVDVDKLLDVNSTICIEKEIAADTIGTIFAATKNHFLPYVEQATIELVDLLAHYYEGIRKSATESLLQIVRTFYKLSDPQEWEQGVAVKIPLHQNVKDLVGHTITPLFDMYDTEDDK